MSFFENTRKPVGFGGKIMVAMMNLGHSPVARWGLRFLELTPDAKGAGLRLRWRGEHQETSEKMSAGHREWNRLFARQRGEIQKGQRNRHHGWPLCRSAGQRGGYGVCGRPVRCGHGL